ncbi:MAG: hypothetical protein C0175_03290 [Caldisericum exile]|jgi:hypothetical protein|uniref:Uncharacterized protein n=1 Tax=Caldisericum exile TaxID=693075 RepID=A0A2J6X6T1_9BACT|nr:MAG: hypothetical protein C0175_03290 [Caldisericum exile]
MTFNLTKSQEKRLALLQRKNFKELSLDLDLILNLVEFPESSIILEKIMSIANIKDGSEVRGEEDLFKYLFDFPLHQGEVCFLVLPGLSPQNGFTYTQYPVIKVDVKKFHSLLKSMQERLTKLDFFSLVFEKFEHGIVLDVYAGNPEIHGVDKEICQVTIW